jgi:hypothetical protein
VRRSHRFLFLAILLAVVLLAGGIAAYRIHEARAFFNPAALLSRFPAEDALVLSADLAALRHAGLLITSKDPIEPEYKQFLDGTGFDYRRDLDTLIASFSPSGTFFIARGRFDWKKLRDYALRQGGSCYQDLCRMQGSTPDRHISFLPLRNDALALAVSTNDLAATRLTKSAAPVVISLPSAPVWISVPGSELRRQNSLPPEMHYMLSALTNADRVVLTFGAEGQGIVARMDATCRTQDDARVLESQLRSTTGLLKEALTRDKTRSVSDNELAAMLIAGSFAQMDRKVIGRWPVQKSLLDALTSGL